MTQVAMLRIFHTRRFWRADNQPWNANDSPECPVFQLTQNNIRLQQTVLMLAFVLYTGPSIYPTKH